MSALAFTDTHVHFHDMSHPELRYEWLLPDAPDDPVTGPDAAIRSQRYWPHDFIGETRFHQVTNVVHVQAAIGTKDPVEETKWLQSFADDVGIPNGIVAYADLAAPDVETTLERHATYANLRGIRDLRYDGYLQDPAWRRGYAALESFDLVCCDDPHLDDVPLAYDLVCRTPGVTFCVDHAGFPKRRDDDYFADWAKAMRLLASAENTVVKISGLGMADHRWTVESIRPWVLECIDAFGVERSFFGTNWPVDRLYSSYGDVVNAYAEVTRDLTDTERRALFSENANRIFRLDDPADDTPSIDDDRSEA